MTRPTVIVGTLCVLAWMSAPAAAQDPTWDKAKKDEEAAKAVEWDASAQAGLIITTGNSETKTMSAGAKASRKEGFNKFQAAAGVAYARSSLYIANDANGDSLIQESEVERPSQTTTQAWEIAARYDRFLTEHNSLYVIAKVAADEPAGKELVVGGQVGYSRQLYKDHIHEVVGEAGYDYANEKPVDGDAFSIHSARGFVGYIGKLSDDTAVNTSGEVLVNMNTLSTPAGEIDRLEDTRITGILELTTKLHANVSFSFGFTAKYDNAPSLLPAFSLPYAPGYLPLADELDTITKASLIINFL